MSNLPQENHVSVSSPVPTNPAKQAPIESAEPEWMKKLRRFILEENYAGAIKMLCECADGPDARNALGVCQLRAGKIHEATETLKTLVIEPGSLVERNNVPAHYRRNFATALLMYQRIGGCLQVLRSIKNDKSSMAEQLTKTIKEWEKTLTFWQKLNWKMYNVIPEDRPIQLNFVPGEFAPAVQSLNAD